MSDAPASRPRVAQKTPCAVDVVAGRTYWWCACGLSKNQPFCDGSHKTTPFVPTRFDAIESKKVWFCGCKQSASAPLCDGTHKTL